jgi:dienelactone hydrolase
VAQGIVIFAHGSGSSRFSPRNQAVARDFQRRGLATLLFDLLTKAEEEIDDRTRHLRFDIPMLADRLCHAVHSVRSMPETRVLPIGLFGASTGGGAALIAAAKVPGEVQAVVSRGGRPDLAAEYLPKVRAPTLCIVGGLDTAVIKMNRDAISQMSSKCVTDLQIVPGATHLFEEPGTLEKVAALAGDWFCQYLRGG